MPKNRFVVPLCCLAAIAALAPAASSRGESAYDPDWSRHFRIGALVGFNVKSEFKSGGFQIQQRDGIYDDGYVIPDQPDSDLTTIWGYQNASQYNGVDTLTYHRNTSFSPTSGVGRQEEDMGPMAGFDLAYGGNLWYWNRFRIGWEFGFGLLVIDTRTAFVSPNGTVTQSTFSYDTGDTIIDPAPYYADPSQPYGLPLIDAEPSSETEGVLSASIDSSQRLEAILYTFRLGPSVYWDFNSWFGMSVSAGPALGLLSGRLSYDDKILSEDGTSTRNRGVVEGTDVVFGGYVNALVMFHLEQNGDLYIGAQYMPLGTATISGAGREASLDFKGQVYLTAGINWPF